MFEVGDVVVAVKEDECPAHASYPEQAPEMLGKCYRVATVHTPLMDGCVGSFTLFGAGDLRWCQGCFRKLPKADEQFTASIKACRPAHRKTPVSA